MGGTVKPSISYCHRMGNFSLKEYNIRLAMRRTDAWGLSYNYTLETIALKEWWPTLYRALNRYKLPNIKLIIRRYKALFVRYYTRKYNPDSANIEPQALSRLNFISFRPGVYIMETRYVVLDRAFPSFLTPKPQKKT